MRSGKAICPASCGEIVQGTVEGRDFLITCPIALYTVASVELHPRGARLNDDQNFRKLYSKSYAATRLTLEHFGALEYDPWISIDTRIPRSVGLASSTADITATCFAVAQALNKDISPELVAKIALSIEPSDGIMFPGAVLFDHRRGSWKESLGPLPEMDVYIVDLGETVDTVEFNSRKRLDHLNGQKEPQVKKALEKAVRALKEQDKALLGEAMILSALAHDGIIPRPYLPGVIEISRKHHALGVNIAHSGSCLGIFFDKGQRVDSTFWLEIDRILNRHQKKCRIIKAAPDNLGPRIVEESGRY